MRSIPRLRSAVALTFAAAAFVAACSSGESALTSGEGDTQPPETPAVEPEPSDPVSTEDAGSTEDGGVETDPPVTEPAPTTTEAPLAEYAPCPVDALDNVDGTVEVQFWHGMANELEAALKERTDAYNASQDKVKIKLQNQTSYENTITSTSR